MGNHAEYDFTYSVFNLLCICFLKQKKLSNKRYGNERYPFLSTFQIFFVTFLWSTWRKFDGLLRRSMKMILHYVLVKTTCLMNLIAFCCSKNQVNQSLQAICSWQILSKKENIFWTITDKRPTKCSASKSKTIVLSVKFCTKLQTIEGRHYPTRSQTLR